jgi:3-hexulose-6-phosphate synthase
MLQLQIALDGTLDAALALLAVVQPYIDIAEIGTPLIYREGLHALHAVHEQFPNLPLLADLKIMDAGAEEAAIAFAAGASYVTLLGVTQDATVAGAVHSAKHYGRQIVVDMMQVANPLERGLQLLGMGCHILCVHTAFDMQGQQAAPYHQLEELAKVIDAQHLAIAGGINQANLVEVLPLAPAIIVVGGAITRAADPAKAAQEIRAMLDNYADNH